MAVYAIAGGKGGVGKSTTAAGLGVALYDAGLDVAVVDADLAMPNLASIFDVDHDCGIQQVLADRASVLDCVVERSESFYLVPGDESLDAFTGADPANLPSVVRPLAAAVDVVLVDTGAGLCHETLVATGCADGTIVVTTPNDDAVDDVAKTVEFVDHADANVIGAVVTRTDAETNLGSVADALQVPVLGAIPEDPSVDTSPTTTGRAARAYRQLAATLAACHPCGRAADATFAGPPCVDWSPAPDREADEVAGGLTASILSLTR